MYCLVGQYIFDFADFAEENGFTYQPVLDGKADAANRAKPLDIAKLTAVIGQYVKK